MPVVTHAAFAHAQFETMHPFPDGNGRTGRARQGAPKSDRLENQRLGALPPSRQRSSDRLRVGNCLPEHLPVASAPDRGRRPGGVRDKKRKPTLARPGSPRRSGPIRDKGRTAEVRFRSSRGSSRCHGRSGRFPPWPADETPEGPRSRHRNTRTSNCEPGTPDTKSEKGDVDRPLAAVITPSGKAARREATRQRTRACLEDRRHGTSVRCDPLRSWIPSTSRIAFGLLSLLPPTLCHMTTVLSSRSKASYTSCCKALSEGLVISNQPVHL